MKTTSKLPEGIEAPFVAKDLPKLPIGLWADGRGLYIRVEKTSRDLIRRSYVFRWTIGKSRPEHTFGDTTSMLLTDARDQCEKFRAMLREGKDPRHARLSLGTATFKTFVDEMIPGWCQGKN